MTKSNPIVAVIVVVVLGLIGLLTRHMSLVTGFCSFCKTMFVLLGPPADYYQPLAVERAVSIEQRIFVTTSMPRYHGLHAVEITFPRSDLLSAQGRYSARCGDSKEFVRSGALIEPVLAKSYRGYILFTFRVPQDAARGELFVCDIQLDGQWHSPPVVQIVKLSDL